MPLIKVGNIKGPKGLDGKSIVGPKGDSIVGPAGVNGKDGSIVYHSVLKPKEEIGKDGDWAFCETEEIYHKMNGSWKFYRSINTGVLTKILKDTGDATYVKKAGDTMTGDLIGTDFVRTRNGTITRTGDYVSSVALTGGRTLTVTRDGNNYISTIDDGSRTWTFTRDGNNKIASWAVT